MEIKDIEGKIEGILFAAGEPVPIRRLSEILQIESKTIAAIAQNLSDAYRFERRGIRLLKLDDALQLCSAPELEEVIQKALEIRTQPKLSPPALETLAVIAYYQPATRAYIEQIRGVDSSYTVSTLQEKGLIEPCGKLAVPGRPTLYRTTDSFLRAFNLESLDALPPLPDDGSEDIGQMDIQNAIEAISRKTDTGNGV